MIPNQPDSKDPNEVVLELYDESLHSDESLAWVIADEDLALLDNPPQRASQPATAHERKPAAPCSERQIFTYASGPFSIPLSDGLHTQPNPKRRFFRVAAAVTILLIGSALPSIIERVHPARVKASPALAVTRNANVRILTVMAARDETIKDLSVRYTGRFDSELIQEIRNLNPGLTESDNLQDGQIIRIAIRSKSDLNELK